MNSIEGIPLLIPGGSAAFLQELLHRWLNKTSQSCVTPTLAELCGALRSPALREKQIAHKLEQHYLAQSTGLWPTTEWDPQFYAARKQMLPVAAPTGFKELVSEFVQVSKYEALCFLPVVCPSHCLSTSEPKLYLTCHSKFSIKAPLRIAYV